MNRQPLQKVSDAVKKTDDWKKGNMDFLADYTEYNGNDRGDFGMLHRAAEGHVDMAEYSYVLNPYNSKEANLQSYPAKMRNYDIIKPLINSYMGEMADKPCNDEVIVVNADSVSRFKEGLNGQMFALAAQDFVNQLNASGQNTGVPTQELPEYKQFVENYSENWNDQRAIFGQEALDYIKYSCDLKDKKQDAFYEWLVTGRCYTFKEVRDNDVHYETVPTHELWAGHSPTNFVEDSNITVRKYRRNINTVVDMFRHELLPEDIDFLENLARTGGSVSSDISIAQNIDAVDNVTTNRFTASGFDTALGLIDIYHGVWKSFREIAILTYTDPLTGQPVEKEVEGNYKLDLQAGDISLVKEYISQVWEGYRIDRDIYLKIGPIAAQRNELNNSSKCKLPYNGRIGYNKYSTTGSMVRTLLNYQMLYNIYHYRAELTLARNKDKIMTMPIGLIPKDWAPEKAMYYAETTGIMWFDETKPNAASVLSALKGIDLGLGTYVEQIRQLLREIKDEAWDSVGMNRQRYGDTKSSDGKAVNEQAIARSSTISREMFRRFEKFMETDKQGLLDISKVAWIDGKKSSYVTSDGYKKFFEVNGTDHLEADYGIFAVDAYDEQRKLEEARGITNMMAQKGGVGASLIFEALGSNNFSKLKKYAKKFEAIQQQLTEQAAKAEQENQQVLQDKVNANEAANREVDIQKATITAEASITVAQIKADSDITKTSMNNEANGEGEEETNENPILKELMKAKADSDKLALSAGKNMQDAIVKERELTLKKEKLDNDLAIAKSNKNKYD